MSRNLFCIQLCTNFRQMLDILIFTLATCKYLHKNVCQTINMLLICYSTGIVNEVLSCILSCLQITDIIQVFYGNPGPLNQVREPLRQFVRTRVLDGRAATIENIQNSVTELVDGMQADIQDTVVCFYAPNFGRIGLGLSVQCSAVQWCAVSL